MRQLFTAVNSVIVELIVPVERQHHVRHVHQTRTVAVAILHLVKHVQPMQHVMEGVHLHAMRDIIKMVIRVPNVHWRMTFGLHRPLPPRHVIPVLRVRHQ